MSESHVQNKQRYAQKSGMKFDQSEEVNYELTGQSFPKQPNPDL